MNAFEAVKLNCTGCFGCYNACKRNAISMELNDRGFIEPVINSNCNNCGVCKQNCPILSELTGYSKIPAVYSAHNKDSEIRNNSSSGGIFSVLADAIVKDNGYVFGTIFDENFRVKHISANKDKSYNLKLMRGSKYIQSNINYSYREAVNIAKHSKVLFTGTPCQIAALNTFITDYIKDNIITCEVICHGVPSEKMFREYLKYIIPGNEIEFIEFRNKDNGWNEFGTKITYLNNEHFFNRKLSPHKTYYSVHHKDLFMKGFLRNIYLRESCYNCKFSQLPRIADITLGDYWGVNDEKGLSLVLCNTNKGNKLIKSTNTVLNVLNEAEFQKAILHNKRIVNGVLEKKEIYSKFFDDLKNKKFNYVVNKYLRENIVKRFVRKVNQLLK